MDSSNEGFVFEPAPDHPGWHTWNLADPSLFNAQTMGAMLVRKENLPGGAPAVRLRFAPERRHSNLANAVHGAITLSLIDISLFAAMRILLGGNAAGAVTLDLSTQFIGAGRIGEPLDAVVEVLRETGRLVFLRGMVEQRDATIAAFNGTIRKASRP
ncbi:MAG: hypothetical protein RIS94_3163 [Pseudomonadota bacterium]